MNLSSVLSRDQVARKKIPEIRHCALLQSCADERLKVRVRAALVLGVRGEDLADGLQECLDTIYGMSIT